MPKKKIAVDQVAEILKRNKADTALMRAVVEEMNQLTTETEEEGEKPPALKKQNVIVLSDPEGRMPSGDFTGWVVQIPDNESPVTALERVQRGAYDFNASKKGRLMPVKTVGEALESVPAKFFKESEVWVKTKVPVLVVVTNNVLPKTSSKE